MYQLTHTQKLKNSKQELKMITFYFEKIIVYILLRPLSFAYCLISFKAF